MANLVMFSDFLKSSENSHVIDNLNYMSTREGVELNGIGEFLKRFDKPLDVSTADQNISQKQFNFINQLTKAYPDLKEQFSYQEFLKNQNMYRASLFLSESVKQLSEKEKSNPIYMKYISERPGVSKLKNEIHGLFDASGIANLKDYEKELTGYKGNVFRNIISLRREDAVLTGFDTQMSWKNLIQNKAGVLAKEMGIKSTNFRWCAAFHDETYHPHIHMMCWSIDPKEGFLDLHAIESFKSSLVNQVYSEQIWLNQEFKQENRNILESSFIKKFNTFSDDIAKNTAVQQPTVQLMKDLNYLSSWINSKGSKKYSFQGPEAKECTNKIVAELLNSESLHPLVVNYVRSQAHIAKYYLKEDSKKMKEYLDEFTNSLINPKKDDRKVLHNLIIKSAYEIKYQNFIKSLRTDPHVYLIEDKIENITTPKSDVDRNKLTKSIMKLSLSQHHDVDKAIRDALPYASNREKVLENFLSIKDDTQVTKKDISYLSRAFAEKCTWDPIAFNEQFPIHECSKIVQGFVNVIASNTLANEQEALIIYNRMREDEMILKRSKNQSKNKLIKET